MLKGLFLVAAADVAAAEEPAGSSIVRPVLTRASS